MRIAVILAVALAVLAVGCQQTNLSYNNLHRLQKGLTRAQVTALLPVAQSKSRTFSAEGREFAVDEYPLLTAQSQSTSSSPMGRPSGIIHTASSFNTFLCLFENGRLRYWGMLGDFSKSEDVLMQSIAPSIYTLYHPINPYNSK